MADDTLTLPGYQVGDLFAQVVLDVKRSVPAGFTGAIDIQLELNSLTASSKGIFYTKSTSSSMSLKLNTRVYTDTPVVPNALIVAYVQKSLAEDGFYTGKVDGTLSKEVDDAIDKALNAAPDGSQLGKLKNAEAARKYLSYLQFSLNKKLVVKIDVDGYDGPQTQRSIFNLLGDYSKAVTQSGKS